MAIPIPQTPLRLRVAFLCSAAVLMLGLGTGAARAQTQLETGTLTLRVAVAPATDPGRFDLAVDGVPLGLGLGDGGAVVLSPVAPGTFALVETAAAGTTLAAYATAIRCVDGDIVLVDLAAGTAVSVDVAAGQNVVCTFTNSLLPPPPSPSPATVAPPVTSLPVLLPPPFVRGTAVLLGPVGCVAAQDVISRVTGRNIARVVFLRDGRVVKRVKVPSIGTQNFSLHTRLPEGDTRMRTVVARVFFVLGATPRLKVLMHRFAHCSASRVTG